MRYRFFGGSPRRKVCFASWLRICAIYSPSVSRAARSSACSLQVLQPHDLSQSSETALAASPALSPLRAREVSSIRAARSSSDPGDRNAVQYPTAAGLSTRTDGVPFARVHLTYRGGMTRIGCHWRLARQCRTEQHRSGSRAGKLPVAPRCHRIRDAPGRGEGSGFRVQECRIRRAGQEMTAHVLLAAAQRATIDP